MPIKPNGKLTPAYFAALKKILDPDMKENLGWANLSRPDIGAELGISYKDPDLNLILIEISSQLAKTEQAWVFIKPGEYEKRDCPNIKLLTSMLNGKRPRIIDFTNPKEFNIEVLIGEYGPNNLAEKIAVVNWCRSFIANKGAYIALETKTTVGGQIYHGDKHESTTTASAGNTNRDFEAALADIFKAVSDIPDPAAPTSDGSGDMVGGFNSATGETAGGINIDEDGITFGPNKKFDPNNPTHVRLAKQHGFNPKTGKKK